MRLKLKHITLSLSLLTLAVACKEEEAISINTPSEGKTPIELSVGGIDTPSPALTRAVIIDGKGKVTEFENDTRLHLLMVSNDKDNESSAKYTVTYGLAKGTGRAPINIEDSELPTKSDISFDEETKTVKQAHKKSDGTIGDGYYNPANETVSKNPVENNSKDGIVRYWDDAHARSSELSIYGFCINGTILPFGAPWNQKIDGIASSTQNAGGSNAWKAGAPSSYVIGAEDGSGNMMKWTIGDHSKSYNDQTFLSVLYKDDVCYSNNIANYDTDGTVPSKDKRLKFSNKQTKKFDSGIIEFHRAMSLITLKFFPGAGFDPKSSTTFQFANGTNVAMNGFNKKGYLNLQTGEWVTTPDGDKIETGNWTTICNTDEGDPKYKGHTKNPNGTEPYWTLLAFVIPGNDLNTDADAATKGALTFTIDGNEYKLSKQDLLNAIKSNGANCVDGIANGTVKSDYLTDGTKLKAGINYEFTLTIGKSAIDKISASIVDWQTVTAEAAPDNAHDLVNMEVSAGGTETPLASRLFKSATTNADLTGVEKGYSNTTGDYYDLVAGTGVQNTGWFWPNNQTYYHFRTIAPQEDLKKDGDSDANYITMTGDTRTGDNFTAGKDYVWGAPLKEEHGESPANHNIPYDQNEGYKDYLYPAIGPTKSTIHITQFHMMSDLEINLKTTTGDDIVDLTDATVTLNGYANTANLMVGTGLVTDWDNYITSPTNLTKATAATSGYDQTFNWRVVPQVITATDTHKVSLVISTNDGNIYEIKDLSTLPVTIGSTATTIPTWEPGKKYIYNLTLKKTGIDHITATVVNWVNVEATNENITIQ